MMWVLALSVGLILLLRGGQLHNYLVLESQKICQRFGCKTQPEAAKTLPDGRLDFVDLLVQQGQYLLCIEVETTARNVLSNVKKANQLNLPLIVVVPTRQVQKAVKNKLAKVSMQPGGHAISILLLSQLEQALMNYIPLIFAANSHRENKKINQRRSK